MRVIWDGAEHAGRAVELPEADPAAVASAVRAGDGRIECPPPTPVHRYVGRVRPETPVPLRAALAAAARTRGATAPEDEEIAALEAEIEAIKTVDLKAARERLAAAGSAERELRERVARLGGKAEARRGR